MNDIQFTNQPYPGAFRAEQDAFWAQERACGAETELKVGAAEKMGGGEPNLRSRQGVFRELRSPKDLSEGDTDLREDRLPAIPD